MTDKTSTSNHSLCAAQPVGDALRLPETPPSSAGAPSDSLACVGLYDALVPEPCSDCTESPGRNVAYGKNADLYLASGDCLVYLCQKDDSSNAPSFKVHHKMLLDNRCDPLLSRCVFKSSPCSDNSSQRSSVQSDSGTSRDVHLYLPSPAELSEEDTVRWHVSTQNFVAWLLRKPLVGDILGYALVELLNRMTLFRGDGVDNVGDVLAYAREVGYCNFVDSPDHALAFLFFADYCRKRDLWIDAFAHCVGMADIINKSSEYEPNNLVTKLLIKRAKLEMDLHMTRTSNALGRLLEQEIRFFGFTAPARRHLDYFQSTFLQPYLVSRCGYWPPASDDTPMSTYRALCFDLEDLYDYLADRTSTGDAANIGLANGGICVRQHIDAFNKRNKMTRLPFEMPLLPELNASHSRLRRQRSLTAFKRSVNISKASKIDSYRRALLHASNRDEYSILASPLVQAYMQFEYAFASEAEQSLDFSESRKVRWILVYALLQTTLSIVRVPCEVTDTETSYPLCCLISGLPNWSSRSSISLQKTENVACGETNTPRVGAAIQERTPTPIRPDCDPSLESSNIGVKITKDSSCPSRVFSEPVDVALVLEEQNSPEITHAISKENRISNDTPRRMLSKIQSFPPKATYADYQQIAQSQAIYSVDSILHSLAGPPPIASEPAFSASLDVGSDSLPAIRWSTRSTHAVEYEGTGELDLPDLDSSSEKSSFESSVGNRASVRTDTTRPYQPGSTVYIQTSRGKTVLRSDDLPASITRGYSYENRLSSSSVVERLRETGSNPTDTIVINCPLIPKIRDEIVESPVVPAFFSDVRPNIPN